MKKVVSKLTKLLNEGENREKIDALEDVLVESIDETIAEENFYSLPTNEILTILQKSDIESIELLSSIVTKMSEKKGKESPLLLNVIDPKNATFDECINIISNFTNCPLCKRIGQLHDDDKRLPVRDYEHEIEELKREKDELKKPKKASSKKTHFVRVTEKPVDFESNFHNAARDGKLTSVQYLVEQCHSNVEAKDSSGWTPIIWASYNGHLEVVKYLYEECHANVEAKNNDENNHAFGSKSAWGGRSGGFTPIILASEKGHLNVVKYLHEECHATITDGAISLARNDEIRSYLQSKR